MKYSRIAGLMLFVSILTGCAAALVGGAATGAAVLHDRRDPSILLEDQTIEFHAQQVIAEIQKENPQIRIVPVSYNCQLLVLGQVPDEFTRNQVINRLRALEKVKKVFDELSINEPLSFALRNNDAWITTRIKKDMLLSKVVDSTRIKVVTEDSVVYLMGITHPLEAQEAVAIARKTQGVDRVVKVFDEL